MTSPQTRNALGRHSSKIALGVLGLAGVYLYTSRRPPQPTGTPSANPMRTPGVQNIEGAFQKGGATATHVKAYGGTTQGQKDDVMREGNSGTAREKGFKDERGMGDEQRSEGSAKGKVGEKWDEMKYGTKTDK